MVTVVHLANVIEKCIFPLLPGHVFVMIVASVELDSLPVATGGGSSAHSARRGVAGWVVGHERDPPRSDLVLQALNVMSEILEKSKYLHVLLGAGQGLEVVEIDVAAHVVQHVVDVSERIIATSMLHRV